MHFPSSKLSPLGRFTRSRRALLLGALWTSLVFGACAEDPPPPPDVYETRGIVRQLPATGATKPEIYIQHEAITEFIDQNGQAVDMESMAMPFPIAPTTDWEGLRVGDKIAFTFEVQWNHGPPLRLTAWQALDPATQLGFEVPATEDASEAPLPGPQEP